MKILIYSFIFDSINSTFLDLQIFLMEYKLLFIFQKPLQIFKNLAALVMIFILLVFFYAVFYIIHMMATIIFQDLILPDTIILQLLHQIFSVKVFDC